MKKIINQIKYYLSFTKGERRGIFVLINLVILLIILRIFIFPFLIKTQNIDFSIFEKEIMAFEKSTDSITIHEFNKKKKDGFDFNNSDKSFAEIKLKPFFFNPNALNDEQWKLLGLSEKQTKVLMNYRLKGGKYYKKEDFKKMFCISIEEYKILEPYILIPDKNIKNQQVLKFETKPKPLFIVEINTADTNDLQEVKGIGASFARRIANYRDKLGGFMKKEQLLEVFGMDSTRYEQIKASFTVNTSIIQKININKASIQDLKKHPYFDYYLAKSIVIYRSKNGDYQSVSDIKKANLIYDDFYDRVSPYLTVN
ncbi:MAG: helix-hairpin-helix domain-containing protein [Bacteroidales bacterium]